MLRLTYFTVLLCAVTQTMNAQIVTTDPEFPVAGEAVTIFFDATQGTGGLKDHQGDVYAHTGVITEFSSDGSDWRYVVADWGENIPKIKMERLETNLYKLEITPSIREYYGVPSGEEITHMAFVFRNSDGSKEGKAEGGQDIFVEVFESTFNVKFTDPATDPAFAERSTQVTVTGIASAEGSTVDLTLNIDGQDVASVSNDTLNHIFQTQNVGKVTLILSGTDGTNSDADTTTLFVNPDRIDESRPAGLRDGITYVDGSTVRLSLFAPHKDFVYVVGDFNNWQIDASHFMKRDSVNADSIYYWTEIGNLSPGSEYAFQYLVDGEIRVADPYSEKILDGQNDPLIPESIYPGLKPYPAGQTSHLVGVLQPGKEAFSWQHDNFDRPDREDLVIYELLVRDFLADHDYETLTDTLDYLERLGVNAIELMPIMEFDANSSWGYNPTFHLATDKYYGPADDLKRFIDECHGRGMVIILDMVLNHAWGPSPLVRLWNEGDFGKPTSLNPYLNTEPKHDFNVGFDFNHESRATQYFVDRVNAYWLNEFRFDGFRFDLSKGFTQKNTLGNVSAWGQYDASRIRLLKRMADQIWSVDDSAYVILEHFADNSEEQELSDYGMMLWGNMNSSYNEATMGYHDNSKSDFSGVYHGNRGWSRPHLIGYMESHDEERLMVKNLRFGNSSGDYDVRQLATALNRIKLGGAFFFTLPGPKMIWQFGELGYDVSIEENGRTGEKPIKWDYYADVDRIRVYKTFKALLRLRNSHPAFTSVNSQVSMNVGSALKRINISHPEMEVSVIGNFDVTNGSIQPAFSTSGPWYNYFTGDTLNVSDTDTTITLKPGEFHIYTTQKFEAPEEGLLPGS
ncbi:MAG: alpha-amylase family glycosyl hydrolase, partial [Balneolaceae bacterium]|nr:alpha-amylase family glycosyl hydrolase [Balneolaceae bacterium]